MRDLFDRLLARLRGRACDRCGRPARRVRVLALGGSMSHFVRSERWGTVVVREDRTLPPTGRPFPLVLVRYDDGGEEWLPAMPRDWIDRGAYAERLA